MKKTKRTAEYRRIFLCAFCALLWLTPAAQAANRPISQKWDVRNGPSRRMAIQWFAGESVAFDLQAVNGRDPVDLAGAEVIWDVTNPSAQEAYLSVTGAVAGTTARWVLTPEQSNLPVGLYTGYVRAVTPDNERVVLVWQTIKVHAAPAADQYALVEPFPMVYSSIAMDSLLAATSNTLAERVALKLNAADTNQFATADQGRLAEGAVPMTHPDGAWDIDGFGNSFAMQSGRDIRLTAGGEMELWAFARSSLISEQRVDIHAYGGSGTVEVDAARININGQLSIDDAAAASLSLDGKTIYSWDAAGATNGLSLNAEQITTNDTAWTGWTITGTLLPDDTIFLLPGEYAESPLQTNGIARVDASIWSHINGTAAVLSPSQLPYRLANGRWRVTAGVALPGATPGLHIERVIIAGYADLTEAASLKTVSNLALIDNPLYPNDVANLRFVARADARERAYAADQLETYAADADKTLRGSELRLGNMWVVSPADTSGDRFIVSGGEISGEGELIGTTTEFVVSKNGYPLLSFQSDSSGLFITNHAINATSSDVTVSLYVATNGVHSAPFAEWSESLRVGEWSRVVSYTAESYPTQTDGYYTLSFTVPATNSAYFRAMQSEGESVATMLADRFVVGGTLISSALDEVIYQAFDSSTNGVFGGINNASAAPRLSEAISFPELAIGDAIELLMLPRDLGVENPFSVNLRFKSTVHCIYSEAAPGFDSCWNNNYAAGFFTASELVCFEIIKIAPGQYLVNNTYDGAQQVGRGFEIFSDTSPDLTIQLTLETVGTANPNWAGYVRVEFAKITHKKGNRR